MLYRIILILCLFLFANCNNYPINIKNDKKLEFKKNFINKGFTLVYDDNLYKEKIISEKIDNRSLVIFQKNLPKGTTVRITNIINKKSIIATVGNKSIYPIFNNSVITKRIFEEIEIDANEPYVEIFEILKSNSFIAKKAKTFNEEKNVADKAPIDNVSVSDLSGNKINKKRILNNYKFDYIIKIADFYFKDTALEMSKNIKERINLKKINTRKISSTSYRVFLGPYDNLKSLQKAFNSISMLEFENIEILKYEK
jgi:hypothetical protein